MPSAHQMFSSVWCIVFAVEHLPGEQVKPIALAALDISQPSEVQIGTPKLMNVRFPPYSTGPQALIVTWGACDLLGAHLVLGWRRPERIVDLKIEFQTLTNGDRRVTVGGLAGALLWFGCSTAGALTTDTQTHQMRQRLEAVSRLFGAMRSILSTGHALLRGRYLAAVACIEAAGLPADEGLIEQLRQHWRSIHQRVIEIVDFESGTYRNGRFDQAAFRNWLCRRNIVWPTQQADRFDLSDDAFREMARVYPEVRPLKELRTTLTGFNPLALTIGRDGRNRVPLRPFSSSTGRNQPSAKASLLGTAAWVRHLIKPDLGTGLAVIDWRHQEFGIAAALSDDTAMMAAYRSGDPYLALAVAAGAAPQGATKATHPDVRDKFKATALGLQYGMEAPRLARQTGISEAEACQLIAAHKAKFATFWRWSERVEVEGLLRKELQSVFGWRIAVNGDANPRALRNFPMQANGAEMLRLACCLITEGGIKVCAVLHDALVIEAPLAGLDAAVATVQAHMVEASAVVLDGFALETEATLIRAPDRWVDTRGQAVWSAVEAALNETGPPVRQRKATCSTAPPRPILLSGLKEVDPDASY